MTFHITDDTQLFDGHVTLDEDRLIKIRTVDPDDTIIVAVSNNDTDLRRIDYVARNTDRVYIVAGTPDYNPLPPRLPFPGLTILAELWVSPRNGKIVIVDRRRFRAAGP